MGALCFFSENGENIFVRADPVFAYQACGQKVCLY
jgi:hypothetical protein